MGSFRCYDSSNVIATLMVTNFHLNTTDVASFQMFVYGDVVYAQTWYSDPEKLNRATFICQDGLYCCNMALISFRLFRKNLGNLPVFFWANGLPPPLAKNFPYAYDVGPTFSRFNPCPSLPSIATNDRKQFQCLNIVLINKTGLLSLEYI